MGKKFGKGLLGVFWTLILIFALLAASFLFSTYVEYGNTWAPLLLSMAIALISWNKLILLRRRKWLRYEKVPFMRVENTLFLLVAYVLVFFLVATSIYFTRIDMLDGAADPHAIGMIARFFRILLISTGMMYIWLLATNTMFIGYKKYAKSWLQFVRHYLGVFVLYQVLFLVISTICGIAVTLSAQGDAGKIVVSGYFTYVMENGIGVAPGIREQIAGGIASFTTASTYFVLSGLALDSLHKREKISFGKKVKRMLFSGDTVRMLVMSILCVCVLSLSRSKVNASAMLFLFGAAIMWLISQISFLRETKVIMFLLNYTVMTLVEAAIPVVDMNGFASGVLGMIAMAARILLFSVFALHIGYMYYINDLKRVAQQGVLDEVTAEFFDASILQAGVFVVGSIVYRKEIGKVVVNTTIEGVKNRWLGKKEKK